jgi:RNA polymerase sigma-70 factor (ECF subfamily)
LKVEEKTILKLISEKNDLALSTLYDTYAGALYGMIIPIVKDEGLAQDVLQESFVKIWNKMDSYDAKKAKIFTWMYQIARNTAIDAYRKKSKVHIENIQAIEKNVSSKTADKLLHKNELHNMMYKLEPKYQKVIRSLFLEGMTQKELSDETGIPLGTIKSRLRIALRELRFLYNEPIVVIFIICIIYG